MFTYSTPQLLTLVKMVNGEKVDGGIILSNTSCKKLKIIMLEVLICKSVKACNCIYVS